MSDPRQELQKFELINHNNNIGYILKGVGSDLNEGPKIEMEFHFHSGEQIFLFCLRAMPVNSVTTVEINEILL